VNVEVINTEVVEDDEMDEVSPSPNNTMAFEKELGEIRDSNNGRKVRKSMESSRRAEINKGKSAYSLEKDIFRKVPSEIDEEYHKEFLLVYDSTVKENELYKPHNLVIINRFATTWCKIRALEKQVMKVKIDEFHIPKKEDTSYMSSLNSDLIKLHNCIKSEKNKPTKKVRGETSFKGWLES
jgi:hypothetical protein